MAIRLQPNDATAYNSRGIAKAHLEQYFAAIADYDIVIRLKPDDATAYNSRGIAKALLGRRLEAKQDVRTGLRLAKQVDDERLIAVSEELLRALNE